MQTSQNSNFWNARTGAWVVISLSFEGLLFPDASFIWHELKRLPWPLCEVTQASHKMLVFAFLILWEAIDQRFRGVWDACLQTWRASCETRTTCPCVCRSCFSEPWQKCQCWDLHTLCMSSWISVCGPSSLNQWSKCFWSTSAKGFLFQEPCQGLQFPHACNNFCNFLPLNLGIEVHFLLAWCNGDQYSFSDSKTWIFNVRINYCCITGSRFTDLIFLCAISPLSSAVLRGFW